MATRTGSLGVGPRRGGALPRQERITPGAGPPRVLSPTFGPKEGAPGDKSPPWTSRHLTAKHLPSTRYDRALRSRSPTFVPSRKSCGQKGQKWRAGERPSSPRARCAEFYRSADPPRPPSRGAKVIVRRCWKRFFTEYFHRSPPHWGNGEVVAGSVPCFRVNR